MRSPSLVPFFMVVLGSPASLGQNSLTEGISSFTGRIFQEVLAVQPEGENVVISALSIHIALSLLFHGAGGKSRTELAQLLGLEDIGVTEILGQANKILTSYQDLGNQSEATLALASRLFYDTRHQPPKMLYSQLLQDHYLAGIQAVPFSQPSEAAGVINQWVANNTANFIQEVITPESISPDLSLLLLNAIYFKGAWEIPFESDLTRPASFFIPGQEAVQTDTMFLDSEVLISDSAALNSEVVSLKYSGSNITMLLLLPAKSANLSETMALLAGTDFNQLHRDCQPEKALLTLPKFTVTNKIKLVSVLNSLGVRDIFDESNANLTGIKSEQSWVSDIFHQAKIEVNEQGSEAAAVTGISLDIRNSGEKIRILFNRPFFLIIHDLQNNIPLFMGRIVNPSTNSIEVNSVGNRNGVKPEEILLTNEVYCPMPHFKCQGNYTCLRPSQECDGVKDCDGGEDEEGCPTPLSAVKDETPVQLNTGKQGNCHSKKPHQPILETHDGMIIFPCVEDDKDVENKIAAHRNQTTET